MRFFRFYQTTTLILPTLLQTYHRFISKALIVTNRIHAHKSTVALASAMNDSTKTCETDKVRHFCFLIHGWLGNAKEMSYAEQAIQKSFAAQNKDQNTELITYKVLCNDGKTNDGIVKGGKRLAQEINQFIEKTSSPNTINTISIVGNSLGGLYARYAISNLSSPSHFNVFSTTATPHLGISSNTYISLPRPLEYFTSWFMDETGGDLFATSKEDVVMKLCLNKEFLDPLSRFQTRMAYANSFQSDFQVPTNTAAFLHIDSHSKHFVQIEQEEHSEELLLSVYTKNTFHAETYQTPEVKANNYLKMSETLDSLGWQKIFVDVRHLSPLKQFKKIGSKQRLSSRKLLEQNVSRKSTRSLTENILLSYESKELVELMANSDSISLPIGHTVMIANAKNDFYAKMNQGGQVVMDFFAKNFVKKMLQWQIS